LRSAWPAVIWTFAAVLLLLPALIALAIVRFALSLASTTSASPSRRSHFLTDVFSRLTTHRIGQAGNTTVTVARVRDRVGHLVNLRIEGHTESGALALGDVITVRLRTVNGVHILVDGHNHSANERIRLRL
jgi:hypothetical protein